MIRVTESIELDEEEIAFDFIHSSGPGGQNVNKVATAVQLRFDVRSAASIPADVKVRLARLGGSRMTSDGVLVITARRFRSQARNRQDALERLLALIRAAAVAPKRRIATKPSASSRRRRLNEKRRRGETKRLRGRVPSGEE
jgi:ribosome-associated protein